MPEDSNSEKEQIWLARVLLLGGLLPPQLARRKMLPATAELSEWLISTWKKLNGRPWSWRVRPSTTKLLDDPEAPARANEAILALLVATERDWDGNGRGLRLEVNVPEQSDDDEVLYRGLIKSGANSVFLRRKTEGEMTWSWPLRIGTPLGSTILSGVSPHGPLRPLFKEVRIERATMRTNIMLFEGSANQFVERYSRSRFHGATDAVIIFGGSGEQDRLSVPSLAQIFDATGAQGVFIFEQVDLDRPNNAAEGLIAHLSHNQPLDSAIARLAEELQVATFGWATRSLILAGSVRSQGRILAGQLEKMRDARIRVDAKVFGQDPEESRLEAGAGTAFDITPPADSTILVKATDLGDALKRRLRPREEADDSGLESLSEPDVLRFDRESSGASTVAELAESTAAERDADLARREDRYLQARVETLAGRAIKDQARMRPLRGYEAKVFIGARDPAWLNPGVPVPMPKPPEGSPLILDVLFWEPQASPTPQVKQLKLLQQGDSGLLSFPFRTAEGQSQFSARIAVYHQNRNLQTGLLRGNVGEAPADLQFVIDAAPLPKFVGLADRAGVGASIIVNHDQSGDGLAFVKSGNEVGVGSISDSPSPAPVPGGSPLSVDIELTAGDSLSNLTDALGSAITRITKAPEEYQDLSKDGTRTLLLELAQHGGWLLQRLKENTGMGSKFDEVKTIQIVTAHVDAFFPVEYLYDPVIPEDDAKVCGGRGLEAAGAIASGTCCGAYTDETAERTICPLGFWSLSKVIERHAYLPEHAGIDGQFQLRNAAAGARDRLLDPLRSAVLAASTKANEYDPATVTNLQKRLDSVLRNRPVPVAGDWDSWAEKIGTAHPSLLVLLPHHEQSGRFDLLEIGGVTRKSMLIRDKHVRAPDDPDARPIVLLVGCDTGGAKIDLEGFVPAFKAAGAAIVVSTIATILGRHAGPAAEAIVEELKKQERNEDATFGEVMRDVRRRLLAQGTPMVLGLTSYGDADWRIGSTDDGQ